MTKRENDPIKILFASHVKLVKAINKMMAFQMVLIKYFQRMTEPK